MIESMRQSASLMRAQREPPCARCASASRWARRAGSRVGMSGDVNPVKESFWRGGSSADSSARRSTARQIRPGMNTTKPTGDMVWHLGYVRLVRVRDMMTWVGGPITDNQCADFIPHTRARTRASNIVVHVCAHARTTAQVYERARTYVPEILRSGAGAASATALCANVNGPLPPPYESPRYRLSSRPAKDIAGMSGRRWLLGLEARGGSDANEWDTGERP